ncbi:MAG: hypothetical protein ACXVB0_10120 [Mucilaginibacter sp.]
MKRLIILLAITVIAAQKLSAQNTATTVVADTVLKNSWYFEFAGASISGVTINYERFFSKDPGGFSIHGGVGGGIVPHIFDSGADFFGSFTGGVSYNIPVSKDKKGMIEFGGIYSYYSGQILAQFGDNNTLSAAVPALLAGWRHQSASGKTQIRATVLAFFDQRAQVLPWVGFSIGRKF